VLIKNRACGVCHTDLHVMKKEVITLHIIDCHYLCESLERIGRIPNSSSNGS
jgi:D-arabinose 1-dehydrogenase-like Zn-dependent alcohol dehydrogenase